LRPTRELSVYRISPSHRFPLAPKKPRFVCGLKQRSWSSLPLFMRLQLTVRLFLLSPASDPLFHCFFPFGWYLEVFSSSARVVVLEIATSRGLRHASLCLQKLVSPYSLDRPSFPVPSIMSYLKRPGYQDPRFPCGQFPLPNSSFFFVMSSFSPFFLFPLPPRNRNRLQPHTHASGGQSIPIISFESFLCRRLLSSFVFFSPDSW